MSRNKITGLPNHTEDTDAVDKRNVDRYSTHFSLAKTGIYYIDLPKCACVRACVRAFVPDLLTDLAFSV